MWVQPTFFHQCKSSFYAATPRRPFLVSSVSWTARLSRVLRRASGHRGMPERGISRDGVCPTTFRPHDDQSNVRTHRGVSRRHTAPAKLTLRRKTPTQQTLHLAGTHSGTDAHPSYRGVPSKREQQLVPGRDWRVSSEPVQF